MALKTNDNGRLISIDQDPKKYLYASENIKSTDAGRYVELIQGDAKEYLKKSQEKFSYVFMDCEKEDYLYFFNFFVNRLIRGAVLIADNVISHAHNLQNFIKQINDDSRISSTILPIGSGLAFLRWL